MITVSRSCVWLPAIALAPTLAVPNSTQAQHSWSVQARAGMAIPAGELSDSQDPGLSFGAGAAYRLRDRLAARADVGVDLLSGADTDFGGRFADVALYHYNAGLEYDLIPATESPWKLHANAGLGATTSDSEVRDAETEFTLNGGAKVAYRVHPRVHLLLASQIHVILADETQYTIPIQGGVRVLLPR